MSSLHFAFRFLDLRRLVFLALFLSLLVFYPLLDPDYFWHLKTGEYILSHSALPAGDVFSYTNYGRPWVLHEWLFEVVLYKVHAWSGPLGVRVMTAFLAVHALFVIYSLASRLLRGSSLAIVLVAACFAPFSLGVSPRPQLVTYLFFSLFLYALLSFKYLRIGRYLLALPLLMVFWVNFHGGYIIGIALLAVFAGCEWGNYWLSGQKDRVLRQRLILLSACLGMTVLASLLNPYFIQHWQYPFQVMGMATSRNYISEWQSPNFHDPVSMLYLLMVIAFFVLNIYRRQRPDLTELILPVAFVTASFISLRHAPLAVLVLAVFAAVAIRQGVSAGTLLRPGAEKVGNLVGRFGGGKQLGYAEYALNWLLLGVAVLGLVLYSPVQQAKAEQEADATLPVEATRFIQDTGLTGHMFNTYHFGGYLIYHLYPAQKVFIDGRADMYGDAFNKEYRAIEWGRPGWEKLFDKYQIDYVVCGRDTPLRQLLLARGDFKLVYDDKNNSVLVKDAVQYRNLIAKYGR